MDGIIYFNYTDTPEFIETWSFNGATTQADAIAYVNKLTARKDIAKIELKGWFGANFMDKIKNPDDERIINKIEAPKRATVDSMAKEKAKLAKLMQFGGKAR